MTNRGRVQYDDAGRLTTQVESNASNVGIYTMVDGYDAVGNRTSRDTNGTPCTWSYDDAYRLTGQQKSGGYATFAYDANSNLTLKWHQGGSPQTMQHDSADRVTTMLVGGTTSTMQWGQRGVLAKLYETGVIKATYSYADITNDLTRSEETGTVTTAAFDGDDLRRKTVLSGVTTTFVWDGYDYLQARRSSGGDSLFVVVGGEVVAEVRDGTLRDFLTDPLGSVVAHLDSSQNLTAQFEYWPYGELVGTAETTDLPLLWVGSLGYHTDSTLRTYIRRRTYRQDLGSWLQLDPLWPMTASYGYARRPTTEVDPSGLILPVLIVIGIGAGMLIGAFIDDMPIIPVPPNNEPGEQTGRVPRAATCSDWGRVPWCLRCLVERDIEKTASENMTDKQAHFVAGCLAAILCPACPESLGTIKEISDLLGGGTVSNDDAVATDDGYDVGRRFFAGDPVKYCRLLARLSLWSPRFY